MKTQEEYNQQILDMSRKAQAWREANPQKLANIVFKIPPKTFVSIGIRAAIQEGFVKVDDAGFELIMAMATQYHHLNEPTLMMVRIAIENRFD